LSLNSFHLFHPSRDNFESKSPNSLAEEGVSQKAMPLMKTLFFVLAVAFLTSLISCASIKANQDLNELPENIARGDPANPMRVKEYLQTVVSSPNGREVKAYHRRAYSVESKKTLFVSHSFYVFLKDGNMEHTLVFTATPKGSELNGCWMLDAHSDVESYELFTGSSENPWEVEAYQKTKGEAGLDLLKTTQKILDRLDKGYTFFGAAHIRDFPWYHHLWMALVPPPILAWAPMLILGIHTDNCNSAVLETMVWEHR
jgi:hypothetical protein